MTVIDKVAPCRNKRINGHTQKWFDSEVLEKLNAIDELFKKFKKSKLNIDKELYKKVIRFWKNLFWGTTRVCLRSPFVFDQCERYATRSQINFTFIRR